VLAGVISTGETSHAGRRARDQLSQLRRVRLRRRNNPHHPATIGHNDRVTVARLVERESAGVGWALSMIAGLVSRTSAR
jgi:hypothetical protein